MLSDRQMCSLFYSPRYFLRAMSTAPPSKGEIVSSFFSALSGTITPEQQRILRKQEVLALFHTVYSSSNSPGGEGLGRIKPPAVPTKGDDDSVNEDEDDDSYTFGAPSGLPNASTALAASTPVPDEAENHSCESQSAEVTPPKDGQTRANEFNEHELPNRASAGGHAWTPALQLAPRLKPRLTTAAASAAADTEFR